MIGFVLAGMILGLGWDSPSSRSPIDPKILAWVSQLGDKNFRVREQASKELIQAGLVAMPAVRAGIRSSHQEVAERCQSLITLIPKADLDRKLEQLAKQVGRPAPKDLPGVERFLTITGDTREARQLYAEMFRNHLEIVESLENSPGKTSELMSEYANRLMDRAMEDGRESVRQSDGSPKFSFFDHPSEVVLFLFVRGDRRFNQLNKPSIVLHMASELRLQKLVLDTDSSPLFRKLFVDWYRNEKRPSFLTRGSEVVRKGEMRELIPTMLQWLDRKETNSIVKIGLLKDLAFLGDRKLLPHIEPLLKESRAFSQVSWKNKQGDVLVSELVLADVALNVCWIWAGQKHEDLGTISNFIDKDDYQRNDFSICSCFEDEKSREAAHAKWKKLRAEMLKADEKKGKQ